MKRPDDSIALLLQRAEKDEMIVVRYLDNIEKQRDNLMTILAQISNRYNLVLDLDKLLNQ
jgi:hypothetical protein